MEDILEQLKSFEIKLPNISKDIMQPNDNIFEVLNIIDKELKHSDFLAYILDPNSNHNLGTKPLKLLCETINKTWELNLSIDGYEDIVVKREYNHMDLLIISRLNKFMICIENKIWTVDSEGQLENYDSKLEKEFNDYNITRIYLTPTGEDPLNYNGSSRWWPLSYSDILEAFDKINDNDIKGNNIKNLFNDYKYNLRRNIIMDNNELKKKCNEIYQKNKEVLDTIYNNIDDDISNASHLIKDYLNKMYNEHQLEYYKDNQSASTTIWFIPKELSKYLPLNADYSYNIKQNKCLGYITIYLDRKYLQCYIGFFFNYSAAINKIEMNEKINEYLSKHGMKQIKYNNELYKNKQISVFSIEGLTEEEILQEFKNIINDYIK